MYSEIIKPQGLKNAVLPYQLLKLIDWYNYKKKFGRVELDQSFEPFLSYGGLCKLDASEDKMPPVMWAGHHSLAAICMRNEWDKDGGLLKIKDPSLINFAATGYLLALESNEIYVDYIEADAYTPLLGNNRLSYHRVIFVMYTKSGFPCFFVYAQPTDSLQVLLAKCSGYPQTH